MSGPALSFTSGRRIAARYFEEMEQVGRGRVAVNVSRLPSAQWDRGVNDWSKSLSGAVPRRHQRSEAEIIAYIRQPRADTV